MAKGAYIGVGGKARKIKKGYIGVDGVARKMKSGYVSVNGVARQFLSAGVPLSEMPIGSVVTLNENGSPVEFYVATHDYESGLNGEGRTLLVRKILYVKQAWDAGEDNDYRESDIDAFLNNDYLAVFDAATVTAIGTTKFYWCSGSGVDPKTVTRAAFLLSCTELGLASDYFDVDGSTLPDPSFLRVAYTAAGSASAWWTRSLYNRNNTNACYIRNTGLYGNYNVENEHYVRPALTLPETTIVNPDTGAVAL